MATWMDYMVNPRGHQLKRVMFEFLKERFAANEQIVERLGSSLMTENDMKDFLKMVTDVYEIAYLKAVNDHREQLQKLGIVARVTDGKS
mgnify:CR=1 FL=1